LHGRGYQTVRFGPPVTPNVIKQLLIANLAVFVAQAVFPALWQLVDVAPSGRAQRIAEGAALVRDARRGARAAVSLGDTGYRLRPGHRLRLEVASSCFPRYLLHPGSEDDPWHATRFTANRQSLTTGGLGASTLVLTVLPGPRKRRSRRSDGAGAGRTR